MGNVEWNYKISRGSGQKKDKDDILIDQSTKFNLSISAKGSEENLLTIIQKLAPLIAKIGGQETLDLDY
ncbi:MAG: hypothetical protein JKY15_01815 [Deltaproteobacteria bacterium]|nr:hypothetical protein [Deltaproteobacteria bacterium]